jgi:hypothetical protein
MLRSLTEIRQSFEEAPIGPLTTNQDHLLVHSSSQWPLAKAVSCHSHASRYWDYVNHTIFGTNHGPVWKRTIFQLSNEHPILQNLLAAIAYMSISFSTATSSNMIFSKAYEYRSLALYHSQLSIQELSRLARNRSNLSIVIISCSLFVVYEFLGTLCCTAQAHLRQLFPLYETWQGSSRYFANDLAEERVIEHFVRPFMLKWRQSGSREDRTDDLVVNTPSYTKSLGTATPFTIDTIDLAREHLVGLITDGFQQLHRCNQKNSTSETVGTAYQLRSQLLIWLSKFDESPFNTCTSSDKKDEEVGKEIEAILLKLQARVASILACTVPFQDEMLFDKYSADFEHILDECERYVVLSEEQGLEEVGPHPFQLKFSVDLRILPPLWMTASRCREPRLRRRAIHLLLKARRREAEWSSVFNAYLLERIMAIEEDERDGINRAQDVASHARIRVVQIHYDPGDKDAHTGLLCGPRLAFKFIRHPFDETVGPFFDRFFEISEDDLAETQSLSLNSSSLSKDPATMTRNYKFMEEISERYQHAWTKWLITSGRYDASYAIGLHYGLDQDYSTPIIGSISY